MKSFVVFDKNNVFSKFKAWELKDIKGKYPQTEVVGDIYLVNVKASGRVIQQGILLNAEDELEAIEHYRRLKNG